jgi:uncharacterized sporulation protein YeaH/YhbH (DUF444 family)
MVTRVPADRAEKMEIMIEELAAKVNSLDVKLDAASSQKVIERLEAQKSGMEAEIAKLREMVSASDAKWDARIEKAYGPVEEPPAEEEKPADPKAKKKKPEEDEDLEALEESLEEKEPEGAPCPNCESPLPVGEPAMCPRCRTPVRWV